MSTSAVFYVGKGNKAKIIFAQSMDGYPEEKSEHGVSKEIFLSKTEGVFIRRVEEYSKNVPKDNVGQIPESDHWSFARHFSYTYCFFDGHVWVTQGGPWFNPFSRAKRPTSLPPYPALRRGEMEGFIRVTCGQCFRSRTATAEQLVRLKSKAYNLNPHGLLEKYFLSQGFNRNDELGWYCKKCLKV